MKIETEPFEDFAILHLRGEFDGVHCARVQQEIDDLMTAGVKYVALNLRRVKFINSTALGAIVRASKRLARTGGRLVVARPSPFCRGILDQLMLERLIPICDSDGDAHRALLEGVEPSSSGELPEILEDESTLLFTPLDPDHAQHFIPAERRLGEVNPVHRYRFGTVFCGVGQVTALHHDGLRFLWNGGRSRLTPFEMGRMLAAGTELKVKFRLPLLQKGHCHAVVTIGQVQERTDGVKLEARFKEIDAEALEAVRQYAGDLEYLRQELRSGSTLRN